MSYSYDNNPDTIGLCVRCTHPVVPEGLALIDLAWGEERCYPHDDPQKTHIVRSVTIETAINYGADRPTAVWNALHALVRAERVNSGLRGSHVKSASKALAAGRADW